MGPFPAITVLALLNGLLLCAIAVAPLVRRWRVRAFRRQQIAVRREPLTTNHQPLANHQPLTSNHQPAGDDLELCATLTRLDRQARYELLASLDRHDQSPAPELLAMAADRGAADRIAAIRLLGTTCDSRARRVLTTLLGDPDPTVRRVSAAAAAWSARVGYPTPLDEALVERLLQTLEHEPLPPVVAEVIEALTYSLDPRVPAALLRQIPSSRDAMRERLVESTALFTHLTQSAERRQVQEGVAAR
jgi:HEAT repeat protein